MTGVIFPASMSSVRNSMSSWFSREMNVVSFWLVNRDSTSARSWRSVPPSHLPPVSPPAMTSGPAGGGARRRPRGSGGAGGGGRGRGGGRWHAPADVEDQVVAPLRDREGRPCVVDDVGG